MGTGVLSIDLGAIAQNWRDLDAMTECETAAVVKANAYGLGAPSVARALARAGARTFFVAVAEEGAALRAALGRGPKIYAFSGHMPGDAALIRDAKLIPILNSIVHLPTATFNTGGGDKMDGGRRRRRRG